MGIRLQTILILAIILLVMFIFNLLKKKRLFLKYTLLWLLVCFLLLVLAIFPNLLNQLRDLFGFTDGMNALFVLGIGFLMVLILSITAIVSGQSNRMKKLVQQIALMDERIRELEKNEQ